MKKLLKRHLSGNCGLSLVTLLGAILVFPFQSSRLAAAAIPKTLSDVRGFNYTPASARRSWDMWLQFNAQEIDRDFGYANELRLNQARVFLPFGAWEQDPKTFSSNLASFMDIAHQHRIGVMLVLVPYMSPSGNGNDVAPDNLDSRMQSWIKAVVDIVKDKPSMAFWDVQNEPDHPGPREHPRSEQDLARRMYLARMLADTVHEVDKVHPTTVGCTYEKCMEDTAAFADVLSFHDYSPAVAHIDENLSKAGAFAARVGKPLFNTEMGCVGRANPYDIVHSGGVSAHEFLSRPIGCCEPLLASAL